MATACVFMGNVTWALWTFEEINMWHACAPLKCHDHIGVWQKCFAICFSNYLQQRQKCLLKNSRRWSVDRHWRILSRIFENSSIAKRGTPDTCMETTLWELILSWKWAKWVSTATWSRKRVWKRSSAKTPVLVSFPDRTFKLLSDISDSILL